MQTITEANCSFYVGENRNITKKDEVFFNENAKNSRDIITLISRILKPKKIIDLNSGSGAMSIRIAKGINFEKIDLYDCKEEAIKSSKENAKLNNIQNINFHLENSCYANIKEYDLVLIDPFGSPKPIYSKVIQNAKIGSIISLKATDIGTLTGKYPKKAKKTYNNLIVKNPAPREIGIRSLILYAIQEAKKHNVCVKPIFSYATNYYIHTILKVTEKYEYEKRSYIGDDIKIDLKTENLDSKIYYSNKSDQEIIKKMEKEFLKQYKIDNMQIDTLKIIQKAKCENLFEKIVNIHLIAKKNKLIIPKKHIIDKIGVDLPFDDESITTNKSLEEIINHLCRSNI